MRVALTYMVPVVVEVDTDKDTVERVIVIDDSLSYNVRPTEVEIIDPDPGLTPDEIGEVEAYALNVVEDADWPAWEVGR